MATWASGTSEAKTASQLESELRSYASSAAALTERGPVTVSTTYNVGDVAYYQGRRIRFTSSYTTGSSSPPFVSGGVHMILASLPTIRAYDFGFRADGSTGTAAANTAALKSAISYANAVGGAVVELPLGFAFVNKDGSNAWAIEVPYGVILKGQGVLGTWLRLNSSQNCTTLKFHTSTNGTSDRNSEMAGVMHMTIDGQRTGQSSGSYHGIDITTNPTNTKASGDAYFDPHHILLDVRVKSCKGNGVNLVGRSGTMLNHVFADDNDGHGIVGTFDTQAANCQASNSGLAGFFYVSQAANCKAFLNGRLTNTYGGFEQQSGAATITGVHSQNNAGPGVRIKGTSRCYVTGLVDGNNTANGTSACAVELDDADYCLIDVVSTEIAQGGVQIGHQTNAIRLINGSTANDIRMTHSASVGATVGNPVSSDSTLTGNRVFVNGVDQAA